jgi:tRNA(fMet)-specific endonuclease VapC
MSAMLDYFRTVNVIDFDLQAHAYFFDLVHQKIRIGTQDLRITAIALSIPNEKAAIRFDAS